MMNIYFNCIIIIKKTYVSIPRFLNPVPPSFSSLLPSFFLSSVLMMLPLLLLSSFGPLTSQFLYFRSLQFLNTFHTLTFVVHSLSILLIFYILVYVVFIIYNSIIEFFFSILSFEAIFLWFYVQEFVLS
jgi:hypothetical protein